MSLVPPYVLDTSAILALLADEPGADRVEEILDTGTAMPLADSPRILVPFIAFMEVEYWLLRRQSTTDAEQARLLVENWPIRIVESTAAWRHEAARIKATTPLSLADSWIAALALIRGATLVHMDPEYDQLTSLTVERLPYKPRQS